ncbi:MAG: hypothetical protein KOO60_08870 [Gemmatimonadales bacterium]|nr:hypothetical protein [Gemmatimonadales bacterium]
MKKWLFLLVLGLLGTAGLAQAQCSSDPDEICILWTDDCGNCLNCMSYFGGPVTFYVVLMNCSTYSGLCGFEFQLVNADGSFFMPPPSIFVVSYNIPSYGINVATPPSFQVGLGAPIPWSPCIVLVSVDLLVFDYSSWCFGVKPFVPASVPGEMIYVAGHDPSLLLPMRPCTGSEAPDYGIACLNSQECPPPVVTDRNSWGSLKSMYK